MEKWGMRENCLTTLTELFLKAFFNASRSSAESLDSMLVLPDLKLLPDILLRSECMYCPEIVLVRRKPANVDPAVDPKEKFGPRALSGLSIEADESLGIPLWMKDLLKEPCQKKGKLQI